jgi:probable F420-dependent oxidoreductase
MDFGVFHVSPNSRADPAVVAKHAEGLGFESYWVADHTIVPVTYSVPYPGAGPDGREPDYLWQIPDPLIALARASVTTQRIKLGTGICLVAERHPILLAKQVATLDDLSGGRVIFGIGGGWNPEECTILGGDFDHRWSQVKDYIAAMRVLWTEHASEYHGKYVSFEPVRCYPKPARKPHPPILLGSVSNPRALRRVAEWGDGWLPVVQSVEEFANGVERISAVAKVVGRDVTAMDFTVFGMPGQWRSHQEISALERAGAGRVTFWLEQLELDGIRRELDELARSQPLERRTGS